MEQAACLNHPYLTPEDWFTAELIERRQLLNEVRAACNVLCPVNDKCLAYALKDNIQDGVWGGLTSSERRRLQRNTHRKQLEGTA